MTLVQSDRGFWFLMHEPRLSQPDDGPDGVRVVSESSAIGDYEDSWDRPGSSFLWLGDRLHLNREEVAEAVKHMQRWLDTGRLAEAEVAP